METLKLYYEQPSTASCEATVLSVMPAGGQSELVLDRTPFYPEGGGQPCDLGTIGGFRVVSVSERDGVVSHRLDTGTDGLGRAGLAPGSLTLASVDMERRRDHTEQHTAQHLLSATVLRMLGAPTRSFHLGERECVIDVDIPAIEREDADAVAAEVMRAVRDGYPVRTHLCPPEDPGSFPLRRKPPEDAAVLRIVELDGLDYTPCCGTHLKNSSEIGLFRILRTEKYKGMTRIHFLAGGRAYAGHVRLSGLARSLAAAFGCSEEEIADAAASGIERARRAETGLDAALDRIAELQAALLASRFPGPGPVSETLPDSGFDGASRLAKALAAAGRVGIVAGLLEPKAAAASPAGGPALGERLKPPMAALGGKGGGGPTYFQAAFPDQAALRAFMDAAAAALA